MTDEPRKRGRPPAYDPDQALASARDVFWDGGYAASSLDELSAAMAMNRPSLYGAFGDKEALYLKTLERYRDDSLTAMREALDPTRPLREGLGAVYAKSIDIYLAGLNAARGCFLIGTATAEAVSRAAVRDILRGSLRAFDEAIQDRLTLAVKRGELSPQADPAALALIASAIMHSLAVRARAGEQRPALEALARSGVALICPSVRECGHSSAGPKLL
jgi:AcrR family transcriptional regulator